MGDVKINIPLNLLTVDDFGILLRAEKHSQLTIIERAMKYAKIFSLDTPEVNKYKNNIIAKALITVLYSQKTASQKKDDIFTIIDTCHTKEFNFDSRIPGIGYTRSFSECFAIDSKGRFGEEVLITGYILKYVDEEAEELTEIPESVFSLLQLEKALKFTLISEGFNQNKMMHDDAQLLKVRLNMLVRGEAGNLFTCDRYVSYSKFITELVSHDNKKAQVININLEGLDDALAKAIVKIYSRIIFDFAKGNANRATVPFHLFLEEAHRYIQNDNDVFLLGYNIFDRIAKEGRKYGVILDIISQRPVEISDTVVSQCSNFLIFKMTHPKDIKYIEEMLPNISADVIEKMKILQPGTCVAFGSAFKIPMICKLEMPNPRPFSASCNVSSYWDSNIDIKNDLDDENTSIPKNNGTTKEINPDIIADNEQVLNSDNERNDSMDSDQEKKKQFFNSDNQKNDSITMNSDQEKNEQVLIPNDQKNDSITMNSDQEKNGQVLIPNDQKNDSTTMNSDQEKNEQDLIPNDQKNEQITSSNSINVGNQNSIPDINQ